MQMQIKRLQTGGHYYTALSNMQVPTGGLQNVDDTTSFLVYSHLSPAPPFDD